MSGMGPQRAFGNVGQANDVDLALGGRGVTPTMSQQIVTDKIRRMSVAAACRGEIGLDTIEPKDWIERERVIGERLAEFGLPMFDQEEVIKASELGVGINDRFVPSLPEEKARKQLLKACEKAGIKLYTGNSRDGDWDGERLSLETGIFSLDYNSIFRPTNAEQHPYVLTCDQQWTWASKQGGNGFSTAEEAIYMAILRPKIEIGYLPYQGGWICCQNTYGSDDLLSVRWHTGVGLGVYYCTRHGSSLWSLPRKLRVLGS